MSVDTVAILGSQPSSAKLNYFNVAGQVYNTSTPAYEAWDDTHYANYGVSLTQQGTSGVWEATRPAGVVIPFSFIVRAVSGGTPSTDPILGAGGSDVPEIAPGASGGLLIAGSNAATTFATLTSTGAFTINGTANVAQTGDSFARIGANGSGLTSLAPSATALSTAVWTGVPAGFLTATFPSGTIANQTNITGGTITTVTGSVASVTGNVGGNVTGSVGSIASGGISSSSFAAGAINSTVAPNLDAAVSSRMATYSQPTGFLAATFPTTVASPTNITAGTITTTTNLTNAPTAGDFTAAMKASLNAATPAVTVSDKTGFALTSAYDAAKTAAAPGASMDISSIAGDATAATNQKLAALAVVVGVVGDGSTTTSIVTSSLSPAAVDLDQFKGRIILFARATTTAGLRAQGTNITSSSAGGILTVTALTEAPVAGDTFIVV